MQRNSDEAVVEVISGWVRALVDRPELAQVHAVRGRAITVLEVSVDPGDIRRIIGRGGRTANAIRALLMAIGGRRKIRYDLQILEPTSGGSSAIVRPNSGRPDHVHAFDNDPVEVTRGLVHELADELVDHGESVSVDVLEGSRVAVLEVKLDQADVARVLGRKGRTISALRELLQNLGCKSGRKFVIEVVEPVERVD